MNISSKKKKYSIKFYAYSRKEQMNATKISMRLSSNTSMVAGRQGGKRDINECYNKTKENRS
jgi:hypothetical protein